VLRAVGPNGGWVVDQPMWSDEKAIGAAACAAPRRASCTRPLP
jgi:hypothetical protein